MADNIQMAAKPTKAKTVKAKKAAAKVAFIDFEKLATVNTMLAGAYSNALAAKDEKLAETIGRLQQRVEKRITSKDRAANKASDKLKAKLDKLVAKAREAGIDVTALLKK